MFILFLLLTYSKQIVPNVKYQIQAYYAYTTRYWEVKPWHEGYGPPTPFFLCFSSPGVFFVFVGLTCPLDFSFLPVHCWMHLPSVDLTFACLTIVRAFPAFLRE